MANEVGTATNLEDLFTKIVRFVCGYATFTAPTFTGTGTGTITKQDAFPSAVSETWTLTCTAAAANGGTFSVVGSVSGAKAAATVGTPYNNGQVAFLINDGATDFLVGDQFVFTTTAGVMPIIQRWTELRTRRDNLAAFTSSYAEPTAVAARRTNHTYRYDARSINVDQTDNSSDHFWYNQGGNVNGSSYLQWQLREAREIAKVQIKAGNYAGFAANTINKWRLQYSDDGLTWTTAYTQATLMSYVTAEVKEFAIPASGKHIYWKLIVDYTGTQTTYAAWERLLLLEADGTVANHFGSETILKAPGNSGADEIFVGIRSEYDLVNGWYNLVLNGYTGYSAAEESWFKQPGALPGYGSSSQWVNPMVPAWNDAMPYWFSASGRSFRMGLKVGSSYETAYLGLILPYATPGQYPYPLMVAGSLTPQDGSRASEWRYSWAREHHGGLAGPGASDSSADNTTGGVNYRAMLLRDVSGAWLGYGNRGYNYGEIVQYMVQSTSPPYDLNAATGNTLRGVWPHCAASPSEKKWPYRECLGGGYILQPCVLVQRIPVRAAVGEMEGVYSVSGYGNASENTTTIGGKTAIILQNCLRTTVHEFMALTLD